MKHIIFLLSALFTFSFVSAQKPSKITETTFFVNGVCNDCKGRIERAARYEKGVKQATWDKQSGQLSVIFRNDKTSQEKIEHAIANAGYDTENVKAPTAAYDKLPDCCSYRRDDLEKH